MGTSSFVMEHLVFVCFYVFGGLGSPPQESSAGYNLVKKTVLSQQQHYPRDRIAAITPKNLVSNSEADFQPNRGSRCGGKWGRWFHEGGLGIEERRETSGWNFLFFAHGIEAFLEITWDSK